MKAISMRLKRSMLNDIRTDAEDKTATVSPRKITNRLGKKTLKKNAMRKNGRELSQITYSKQA